MNAEPGLAEREVAQQASAAQTFAQALADQVSVVSDEVAAIPAARNPLLLELAELAVAAIPTGVNIAGPIFLFETEHHLMEAGLTGARLALACGIAKAAHDMAYVARSRRTTVHQTVRAECRRWRSVARSTGRSMPASRPRTPHRAGRSTVHGASRRASARSGDSGSDDPDGSSDDDDPAGSAPPLDGRRFCVCGCGLDISDKRGGAKFHDATHRQRRHRHPDTPGEFADPYLTLLPLDRDALQAQAVAGCRCNGSHVLDAEFGDCAKCGRPYRDDVAPYYLRLWERRDVLPSYLRAATYGELNGVAA